MTQMGFVTKVEQAPAVTEAYPRENHTLSSPLSIGAAS